MMEGVKKKKKKKKCSASQGRVDAEDRISGLPDSLLEHILSFLEMKDVIRTSVLSRRWRYLWTSVPVLDFGKWMPDDSDVATFIDLSLMLYEARKIRRFHVDLYYEVDACHIDSWIRFAMRRDVEELDIKFFKKYSEEGNAVCYRMPRCLLDCGKLRVLRLMYCDLTLHSSFCFRSLAFLHLCRVELTDLDISGCPLLEKLIMEECNNSLNIYAPNRKLWYLKIDDCEKVLNENCGLTLYAPYLLSIEFTRCLRRFYNFKNLSSIGSASLDVCRYAYGMNGDDPNPLVELLKNLSNAKTLKLCHGSIVILYYGEPIYTPPLSATCMELKTELESGEIHVITSLLSSSSCLETLIINISSNYGQVPYNTEYSFDETTTRDLELALSANLGLRTVVIRDFLGSKSKWCSDKSDPSRYMDEFLKTCHDIKLVRALLKCCKMLDRLIISTIEKPFSSFKSKSFSSSKFLRRIKRKVLAFPRASENAVIDFS